MPLHDGISPEVLIVNEAVNRLQKYCRTHNIALRAGNPREALRRFEQRNEVRLPPDVEAYFSVFDGMGDELPRCEDKIRPYLWPLDRVKPVTLELKDYLPLSGYFDEPERYFVFADYLLWSHAFAMRLPAEATGDNTVMLVGAKHPMVVAPSFAKFIELYVEDSSLLYG